MNQQLASPQETYYQKNKELILEQKKEYHLKNRDEILKKQKEYYKKNKQKLIKKRIAYQKETNYKYEKTPEQRERRNIKRKTRLLSSLSGKRCECGAAATCRHHTTTPISVNDFIFCCSTCHNNIHANQLEGRKK